MVAMFSVFPMVVMVSIAVAGVARAVSSFGQCQAAQAGDQNAQDHWAQDFVHVGALWV
jgi:hypothetical protein